MSDWWRDWPWRMIQTNMREIDMADINAERVVADLQSFQATVVLVNAAGIIASYPTKLPYHFQSQYLQGDSLAQIIAACHAANIKVLARTDFSKVRRPIYEQHPEWAYISPQGKIVDYNGDVHVCLNGDYQQHYALEIMRELLTTHDFDGIFFNMGGYQVRDYSGNYYGPCHCEQCKRRFAEMYGLSLPTVEDMNDPVYRKYAVFRRRTLREHHEKVYRFLTDLKPGLCIANHTEFGRGFIRQESNTAIARPLPHWQYSGSDNTKWAVGSYPEMVSSNTTVDFIDFPYRHVAVSPAQQQLRLAQSLANGGALDYYIIGRLDNHEDRSGYAPVRAMFRHHAANENEYFGLTSLANIALLNGPDANQAEYRGWYRFLAEGHFLFDVMMAQAAPDLVWDKYRAIVVPDYQPLSDALAAKLDDFCQRGGIVIATSRTGLRDEDYEPRPEPALRCLGVERIKLVREDMSSSYFKFDDKSDFPRFEATDLVYLDGRYLYADYADDVTRRQKLIPPHMFGPPERCYYTQVTDHPGFTVRRYGEGLAIYAPWEPGALFYRQGHTNTSDWATDLLEHAAGLPRLRGNLPPMVEATLFAQKGQRSRLLHLVNGSGHFGVSFYPPAPLKDVEVVLDGPFPWGVRSLYTGEDYSFGVGDDEFTVYVPQLDLFDAIRIDGAWLMIDALANGAPSSRRRSFHLYFRSHN